MSIKLLKSVPYPIITPKLILSIVLGVYVFLPCFLEFFPFEKAQSFGKTVHGETLVDEISMEKDFNNISSHQSAIELGNSGFDWFKDKFKMVFGFLKELYSSPVFYEEITEHPADQYEYERRKENFANGKHYYLTPQAKQVIGFLYLAVAIVMILEFKLASFVLEFLQWLGKKFRAYIS